MSLLIIGGEEEERKEKALFIAKEQFRSSNFDLHSFPPEGKLQIGIEEAFEAKRKSNFKPFNSAFTTLLFLELQRATIEAQNALLKLIEEPPKTTKILITAQNESLLPAPIVSRCTFLRLKIPKNRLTEEKETRFALEILFLFAAGIGKRLEKAEKLAKDKKEALDYLRNVIFSARFVIFSRLRIYESALAKKIAKISSGKSAACRPNYIYPY